MIDLDILGDTTDPNELFPDSVVSDALDQSAQDDGPTDYGEWGVELNWEDSFGPASKHLGVSEGQWKFFIDGINQVKQEMALWVEAGGNSARVMQTRSVGDAISDRRIAVLMSQGQSQEEAEAEVYGSEEYAERSKSTSFYEEMNEVLNQLYASVGLDAAGSISGGTGTSHGNGYTVNFDFVTGETTHNKGDAVHDFGKALIKGVAASAFGYGLTGFLSAPASAGGLGLPSSTAKLISKFVVSTVTGSGGEVTVEDAIGLAFGSSGFEQTDFVNEITSTVVDFVTNPENYGDNNTIVFAGSNEGANTIGVPSYETYDPNASDDPMEGTWWYDLLQQIFRPEDYEDDTDRLERQAAANRWIDAVRAYENGEITLDELKAVDVSILADIPGWDDYYGKVIDGTGSEADTAAEQLEKDSAEPEQKEKDPAETNKDSDGETEKDKDVTETEKDKDAAAEPEEKEKDDVAEAEKDKDADAQVAAEEAEKDKDSQAEADKDNQAETEGKEKDTAEAAKDGGQQGDRNEWRYAFCQSGFSKPDAQGNYVCVSMEELGEVEDKDSEYRDKESSSEQARKDSGEQQEKDQSETDKDDTAAEELEKDTAENVANNAGINKDAEDSALADTTKDGGGGDGDEDGSGDGSDQTGDPGEDQNASVESKDQGETTVKDGESQNDMNEPVNKDGEGFADVLNLKDGGGDSGGGDGGDGEGDILNLFKGFGIGAAASGGFTPPKATDFTYRLDFNPQKISSPILEGQDYLANLERFDGPEQQLDRIIKRNGMLT